MIDQKAGEKKVNVSESSGEIQDLKKRLQDQQGKIDSIWNLISDKKKVEQIVEENIALKKQVAEKDGLIKVIKDKLTEKVSLLNDVDGRNSRMQQELESYKKQIFEFSNKIGAIESRVYATDEQNQKLLYELMRHKERLKEVELELSEKDRLVELQNGQFGKKLDSVRKESEEARLMLMKSHSKKLAVLHAAVDSLKTRLEKQNRAIDEKLRKESALISDFNSKISELLSANELSADISGIDTQLKGLAEDAEPKVSEKKEMMPRFSFDVQDDADSGIRGPSRVDEIVPMIELATDHGDGKDTIRHSLKSSGYSDMDIDDAFSRLNIIEK